jgi:hypothetical protein
LVFIFFCMSLWDCVYYYYYYYYYYYSVRKLLLSRSLSETLCKILIYCPVYLIHRFAVVSGTTVTVPRSRLLEPCIYTFIIWVHVTQLASWTLSGLLVALWRRWISIWRESLCWLDASVWPSLQSLDWKRMKPCPNRSLSLEVLCFFSPSSFKSLGGHCYSSGWWVVVGGFHSRPSPYAATVGA